MNFSCSSNSYVGMRFGSNVFSNLHFQQSNQILQENEGLFLFATHFSIYIPPWIHSRQWFKVHSSYVHMNVWLLLITSIQAFQLIVFYSQSVGESLLRLELYFKLCMCCNQLWKLLVIQRWFVSQLVPSISSFNSSSIRAQLVYKIHCELMFKVHMCRQMFESH